MPILQVVSVNDNDTGLFNRIERRVSDEFNRIFLTDSVNLSFKNSFYINIYKEDVSSEKKQELPNKDIQYYKIKKTRFITNRPEQHRLKVLTIEAMNQRRWPLSDKNISSER